MSIYAIKPELSTNIRANERLTGKLFLIDEFPDGLHIRDIITGNLIWLTTSVVDKEIRNNNIIVIHTLNSKYYFEEMSEVLYRYIDKDKCKTEVNKNDIDSNDEIIVINKLVTNKPIHYGDGFDQTIFEFNRSITKDEFMKFLKDNDYQIQETQEKLFDNQWVYKWIRCYTD